jgi:predicted enzyme related to lactoylglutathione lyase
VVIEAHSKTAGQAREPQRHMLDLHVDDVLAEQSRLQDLGVHFIRMAEREAFGGLVATFLDPDGNYVQLVQDRAP